jgi:hypothetical protein
MVIFHSYVKLPESWDADGCSWMPMDGEWFWWWLVAGHGCEAAGRVATVLGKDFKPYMCLVVLWICPKTVYNYFFCPLIRHFMKIYGDIHSGYLT